MFAFRLGTVTHAQAGVLDEARTAFDLAVVSFTYRTVFDADFTGLGLVITTLNFTNEVRIMF